eukprot:10458253-Prorocentrum_lima.AAC.1
MTSSLVGSEMCIRDRLGIFQSCGGGSSKERSAQITKEGHRCRTAAKSKDCLLYTSDAADDM